MKKTLLSCALLLSSAFCMAQYEKAKQVFESPKLTEVVKTHKLVAILPFETTISYKRPPKNFDPQSHKDKEKNMATSIQSSMYTFLLRKSDNYTVQFQEVDKTNILLKKFKLIDSMDVVTKDQIAKALGVDAVIYGKYETENTRSEAGAIVTSILFSGIGSKTGSGALTMMVSDGNSGDMIWRFFKSMNDNVFTSTDELIDRMMRKVSRNFPYSK